MCDSSAPDPPIELDHSRLESELLQPVLQQKGVWQHLQQQDDQQQQQQQDDPRLTAEPQTAATDGAAPSNGAA